MSNGKIAVLRNKQDSNETHFPNETKKMEQQLELRSMQKFRRFPAAANLDRSPFFLENSNSFFLTFFDFTHLQIYTFFLSYSSYLFSIQPTQDSKQEEFSLTFRFSFRQTHRRRKPHSISSQK
jgi:hypothetical protein